MVHQLAYEEIMGDGVKSRAKVDNIHCSPLIYWASLLIVEGYKVSQAYIISPSEIHTDYSLSPSCPP